MTPCDKDPHNLCPMIQLPSLTHIGGDFNVYGNLSIDEGSVPNLEVIKGDFILAHSGFRNLPSKLNFIGGRVIISPSDDPGLIKQIREADAAGKILGGVHFCD